MPKITKRTIRRQQKRAAAAAAPTPAFGSFMEAMLEPVDPEKFIFAIETYQAAASMAMPVENPGARPIAEIDGKLLSFTDTPLNRGMMAVRKQMVEAGVDPRPYMFRVTQLGELMEQPERLGAFVLKGENGEIGISTSVLHAAALTPLVHNAGTDQICFDMDSLLRIAHEHHASHSETEHLEP